MIEPPSGPNRSQHSASLAWLPVFAGVLLIVFGHSQARLFGAAYAGLAIVLCWIVPLLEAGLARAAATEAHARFVSAVRPGAAAVARFLPAFAAAITLLLLALYGRSLPRVVVVFYLALAALFALTPWIPRIVTDSARPSSAIRLAAVVAFFTLPVAALFSFVALLGANVPFFDEYPVTLSFVIAAKDMTWAEFGDALRESYYGHRLGLTRLSAYLQERLWGAVDFHQLVLLNFGLLIAGVAAIYGAWRRNGGQTLLFVPFFFLVFQPQYHQVVLWGFGSQYLGVFCFCALTVYCVSLRTAPALAAAAVFATCATFSLGSGLFVPMIALALLLDQKRYRASVFWTLFASIVVMSYFSDLDVVASREFLVKVFNWDSPSTEQKAIYGLRFLGSGSTLGYLSEFHPQAREAIEANPRLGQLAGAAGALLLAAFVYVSLRAYWRKNPAVYGVLAFVVVSAYLAASERSQGTAWPPYLSRYAINSALFIGLLYLALAELHPDRFRRWLPATLAASVVFCGFSYAVNVPYAHRHKTAIEFGALLAANGLYQHTLPVAVPIVSFDPAMLETAQRAGIYQVPERELVERNAARPLALSGDPAPVEDLPWELRYLGENESAYTVFVGPREKAGADPEANLGVVFVYPSQPAVAFSLIPREQQRGFTRRQQVAFARFEQPYPIDPAAGDTVTHVAIVPKSQLPEGAARLAIVVVQDSASQIAMTPFSVPAVRSGPRIRTVADAADLLRLSLDCSEMVRRDDGRCWVSGGASAEHPLELPADASIDTLVTPNWDVELKYAVVWTISAAGADGAVDLQLLVDRRWLVVLAGKNGAWEEVVRILATSDTPNWVSVSVSGDSLTLIGLNETESGSISDIRLGTGNLRDAFAGPAVLKIDTGVNVTGAQVAAIHDVRIRAGASTPEGLAAAWPLFDP